MRIVQGFHTFLATLSQCGMLVHPSAVEGFGIILVEATALGMSVIASDIPPFTEVLGTMGGGRIFPLGDHNALAQAIIDHLLAQPIPNGDASMFYWQTIATRLEDVYHDIVMSNDIAFRRLLPQET